MNLLSAFDLEVLSQAPGTSAVECVEAIADRLVEQLEVTDGPVDLAMAASLVDITDVRLVDDIEASACLVTPPGQRSQIHLNASDSYRRRRFSLGHEITHTFFPGYALQAQYRCAPISTPRLSADLNIEALCDVGAANLLLPRRLLLPRLGPLAPDLELVQAVSEEFDASLIATLHRLADLSSAPSAVMVLEVANKPSERGTGAPPKLRVQSAMPHGPGWPFILRHKSVLPGDVFDRALEGEVVDEHQVEVKGVTAMPVICDVQARLYPYRVAGEERLRVVALLTR